MEATEDGSLLSLGGGRRLSAAQRRLLGSHLPVAARTTPSPATAVASKPTAAHWGQLPSCYSL